MQQSQQLQWKRTQIEQCLGSRKRKLSELFSVTAHPNLDNYHAKLKAFQDANNLQSGRRFDESTLPPRARLTRLRRRQDSPLTANSKTQASTRTRRSQSPSKIDSRGPVHVDEPSRAKTSGRLSPPQDEPVVNGSEIIEDEAAKLQEDPVPVQLRTPNGSAVDVDHESFGEESEDASKAQRSDRAKGNQNPSGTEIVDESQPTTSDHIETQSPPSSNATTDHAKSSNPSEDPVQGRSRRDAVSPATSPAEGSQDELPTTSKSVDIPKQPDTPDSTQHLETDDPSTMDIDDAVNEMSTPEITKSAQPTTEVRNDSADSEVQRPSVRLDTQGTNTTLKQSLDRGIVESPAPMTGTAATPRRAQPTTPAAVQDSSKRATRISSGVLQKKSVSEILNEAQRSQSDSATSDSRDPTASERREKERTKLSTVVFAKPQKADTDEDTIRIDAPAGGPPKDRDYLYTLFENKAHSMVRNGSMNYLIANAHKALSTADHLVDYEMQNQCRILKRIYQLQERDRWALRQRKRAEEPARPTSHWDILLDHAKWMRSDFREERRWRLAAARGVAEECAEWVNSDAEARKLMQVKVRPPTFLEVRDGANSAEDVEMSEAAGPANSSHPTPDLIPSNEDDSMSDDLADPRDIHTTASPAAIFGLGPSECTFQTAKTPAFDKVLKELPLYEPASTVPDYSKSDLASKLDAQWRLPIVPVSKFAVKKLDLEEEQPRPKKSRYEYDLEMSPTRKTDPVPPREQNVALFMSENKHIRDRIHPGHSFRPPTEYPMPTQDFFQSRNSSQWTAAEDDELRKLVKDYSYNWSLISGCLTTRSSYVSGADRRTPWECFERWIGLEGLPADMAKTPYFKTYHNRIEGASAFIRAQFEELQRRAPANTPVSRRKDHKPVKVDRKRAQRHLAMLDAMRKQAKKRELAIQKQQHQAEVAAIRKASSTEINQPKAPFEKPQQYAALRQERDQKRAEQQEAYRQQLLAHQRAAQSRGNNPGMIGMPNGMPNAPNGMRMPSGGMPGMPNGNLQVPNAGRPHPAAMAAAMNGMQLPPGMMGPNKMTAAQMQANMVARGMASPEQIRMMQQASKVQQQQQEMMRQAQQNGQQSSPNGAVASLANGTHNMPNGAATPSNVNGNATSPRSGQVAGQLSSGHVPVLTQIAHRLRAQFPQMSDEEIQKHATTQIQMWQQQASNSGQKRQQPQNQAALNAAMGAVNSAAHASNNAVNPNFQQQGVPQLTPEQMQMYQAQRMRMLQAQQQQQNGGVRQGQQGTAGMQGMNMAMQGQMMPVQVGQMAANSPVMNMSRPVSQGQGAAGVQAQQQLSRSATPSVRDARSGSLGAPGVPSMGGSPAQAAGQMARPGSSRGAQAMSQGGQPATMGVPPPLPQQMSAANGAAGSLTPQMAQAQPVAQQQATTNGS